LPALVEPPETKSVKITRCGDGAQLWTGDAGGRGVLVAGTTPPDVVELWDWTLGPGNRHVSEAHAAATQELVHVLVGAVRIEVDHQVIDLDTGDAASFPGDVDHAYLNPHTQPARFSLAVFEPGVGRPSARSEAHRG
jgi:quercetin dioxygenase-like cupin family protein